MEKFNAIDKIEKTLKYDELTGLPNKSFFFDIAFFRCAMAFS